MRDKGFLPKLMKNENKLINGKHNFFYILSLKFFLICYRGGE